MEERNFNILFLIPFIPLFGAFINGVFGAKLQERFGKIIISIIGVGFVFISFFIALLTFYNLYSSSENTILIQTLWRWISFKGEGVQISAPFSFVIDRLSSVMILVVTGVGSIIHFFSTGYMQDEKPYWRYFSFMNLFMFSMLVLVMAENFLLLFVGWEGVGLCSYLLIGYYYEEKEKASAGMKAFIVNRVGDFSFVIGICLLTWALIGNWYDGKFVADGLSPTLSFRNIQHLLENEAFLQVFLSKEILGIPVVTLACLLIFGGAVGKSAQIPLYVWLPDAMAGPTPVSALIHAATMVTAGVFITARCNFLFVHSPVAMTVVSVVGVITAIYAASIGFFQTDIKKVLAYSTVSQLGYMFVGVGVGATSAGIFHLTTHAFFKACLFLCSGSIIYALHHKQDLKDMGGLKKLMPATYITFLFATLAICGIPPFSGFFSKDEILWKAFDNQNLLIPGEIIFVIGLIAAIFTAFYMMRLFILTFLTEERMDHRTKEHIKEYKRMTIPLYILGFLSLAGGFLSVPQSLGGRAHFEEWLKPVTKYADKFLKFKSSTSHTFLHSHSGEYILMVIALILVMLSIFLAFKIYGKKYLSPENEGEIFGKNLHKLIFNKYFVDEIYQRFLVNPFMKISWFSSLFDKWVIDGIVNFCGLFIRVLSFISGAIDKYFVDGLVNLIAKKTLKTGEEIRHLQGGQIQKYIVGIMAGVCSIIIVYFILR